VVCDVRTLLSVSRSGLKCAASAARHTVRLCGRTSKDLSVSSFCTLQVVGAGAGDSDERVRGQAMFALGELASHCQPDMSAHAAQVCAYLRPLSSLLSMQHACAPHCNAKHATRMCPH
jgi:hypothetical protein